MSQRLRVTYGKSGPLRYVAHLDLMRTWERAIRRSGLPLLYSQGFSPHARLSLGAALPVGAAGERELFDAWMSEPVAVTAAHTALGAVLAAGLDVVAVDEVAESAPSLDTTIRSGYYRVVLEDASLDLKDLDRRVTRLLAQDTYEFEERRADRVRRYDLRAAIHSLAVARIGDEVHLSMHLALTETATGRPVAVLAALGVDAAPLEIVRTGFGFRDDTMVANPPRGDKADE